MKKIAINGFGRIGRAAFKIALSKPDIEVVAINDLTDAKTLAHLLQHDSIYGKFSHNVTAQDTSLVIEGKSYPVLAIKEPDQLPWASMGVEVVIESTGRFTTKEGATKHITAGAKKVIITAPVKANEVPTYLLGVNSGSPITDTIISMASCTTNNLGPILSVISEKLGIKKAMMTTIHSYTADQMLVDGPHKDLRRARSAAENIVPTTTGAAIAVTQALPTLAHIFDGLSIRVPNPIVSLSDLTILVSRPTTKEEINTLLTEASLTPKYKGILEVTTEELVSSDFIGSAADAIIDLPLTNVVDGDLIKIIAWYDNEWGYSNRLVELAQKL